MTKEKNDRHSVTLLMELSKRLGFQRLFTHFQSSRRVLEYRSWMRDREAIDGYDDQASRYVSKFLCPWD